MRRILLLLSAFGLGAAVEQGGPFRVAERGASYPTLQQAVDAIGSGPGTILIAPGRYRQCAVQDAGDIVYRAEQAGTAIFDGKACEGKAALVLGGRRASVEGLVFQNLRVADGNGAGIRLQQGDLAVLETLFRDSESGILTSADEKGEVLVERSTFSGLGRCANDCAHSIYVGRYASLTVRRSRFERGTGGHYVKSRARRIEVTDSSFDDSAGRATNYMIDLPEGATGTIARNLFVQGAGKENYSALIVVAAEEARNSSDGLAIADNEASLAPGQTHATAFVADLSGDSLRLGANRLGPRIARFERR